MVQVLEIGSRKHKPATAQQKKEVEEKIKVMQKEGDKMIHGIFEFVDAQGGWIDFSYRFFKGEPIRTVKIIHGEECDLPLILVKHLNNVYKKIRMPASDLDKGKAVVTKTSRCRFTPMEVM